VKLDGNTIFITGGGSGIGRGLAEAFHKLGNQVIIAGRRKGNLAETTQANPGMQSMELNIADPASIAAVANELIAKHPKLNVLINNAGIYGSDDVSGKVDDALLVSTITTNLFGPIRMTSALIDHLKKQESATVINVSSTLAFVPQTVAAVYSSSKAALHSYSQSLRHQLAGTSVKVQEIAPPWVQNDYCKNEPRAMPLDSFIEETMKLLGMDVEEVLVERAKIFREKVGPGNTGFLKQFNDSLT
jgi:uncharacterized oxidoreductase